MIRLRESAQSQPGRLSRLPSCWERAARHSRQPTGPSNRTKMPKNNHGSGGNEGNPPLQKKMQSRHWALGGFVVFKRVIHTVSCVCALCALCNRRVEAAETPNFWFALTNFGWWTNTLLTITAALNKLAEFLNLFWIYTSICPKVTEGNFFKRTIPPPHFEGGCQGGPKCYEKKNNANLCKVSQPEPQTTIL